MKAKTQKFAKISVVGLLSLVFCVCILSAVGCNPKNQGGKDSIFYTKLATYVLGSDYTLSDVDEEACKGGENEVKLQYATTLDLAGHTLNLNGRTLTIASTESGCLVAFKNGSIKGGKVNVSVPNGDVEFEGVTVSEDVDFEMEAASQTIRMNNSTLSGNCTIKSNTHVKIEKSEVFDVTLAGNGFLDVGKGAELTNLSISESAVGAKVNVAKEAKVKGDLTVNAAANVEIYGEVAKLDVKETLAQAAGKTLQVSVKEGAEVLKIDLKAPAEVEVKGSVTSVTVSNESANVSVANSAIVSKVEMKASAKVQVEGNVADIVVAETAKGAKVEVTQTATVQNIVVAANDTQVTVESADSVESVKVVDTVTGANVSDTVKSETITKDEAEDFFAHTCVYKVVKTIEPTCTEAGEITYACIDCGDQNKEYLPALGHDYDYEIITFPTETEDGEGKYTCNRCGDSYLEVLPAGSGTTITVPGLGEMLQQAFGEGVSFNLDGTTFVQKVTENNYVSNALESTKVVYEVYYLDKLNLKFDFSDVKNVKGSMNMVAKIAKLDNLESLDFDKVQELNFTAQEAVYFTLENDTLYGLNVSDTNGNGNIIINIEKAMEFLTNSNDVPQPVKMVASLLMQLTTLDKVEINTTEIQQQILAIAEALQNLGTVAPDASIANFIIENCFDVVTDESGITTYTLSFTKVESTLNKYALMTLSQFADAVIGEGASASIKQTLTLVPDMTVNGAIEYISQLLAPYGITMDDVYSLIEIVAQITGGQPIEIKQMLATMGDMKFAGIIAMSQGITEAEAQQMVEQMVGQVIGMMDQMTVNDALTMLMKSNQPSQPEVPVEPQPTVPTEPKPLAEGAVEETPAEETPAEPTFLDMVSAMLAQYKDVVSLVITTDGSQMADVKVTVADQKFGFNIDMTEGLSFGAIYEQASAIVAQINASFNANNVEISGKAMGYYGSLYTDKQSGKFGLIVGMEVPSQNENGETVVTQTEMVNLVATAINGQFTLKVGAMGIENFIDLTATNANGNLTVMVPAGQNVMPINLTWNIANNALVAYVNLGENMPVFQLTADWSVQNKATVALVMGGMNGEEFVAADTIFNLDFAPVLDEAGLMTGFDVEYLFDGSMFGISMNGNKNYEKPNNGNYTTSDTEFCMIHGVAHLLCNTKVETENTAIGDSSFLSKLTCTYKYWNNGTYSIEYVEEGAEVYYVLTQAEISGMQYVVKQMKVAQKNGVMDVLQLSYSEECTNWYYVNLNAFGEVTTTYYSNADMLTEMRSETQVEDMYFYFYYNVVTKEAMRDTPHTYDYTAELLPGSVTCEDGIQVMGVCTTCGKENNFVNYSHHQVQESIEIAGYPEHTITRSTCVCCGYTYISKESGNHDMEYVNDVDCDVDTIAALGVDTNGFYYGRLEERMCPICNVKYYQYTWYTHDANGCKQNVLIKVGVIDHKTEEMTWLTSVTYAFEGHHYVSSSQDWFKNNTVNEVTDATASSWLDKVNGTLGTSYTFSQLDSIWKETSVCPACNDTESIRYQFNGMENGNNFSGELYCHYENGKLHKYYSHYNKSFADYTEVIGEVPYDFSALSGIAGNVNVYHYEYGEENFELFFGNDDILSINANNDGTSMRINWYKHAECMQTAVYFYKENGMWITRNVETSERHDYTTKCVGENCVEDGTVSVCEVCRRVEDKSEGGHRGGWYGSSTKINGMDVEYGVYTCCNSLDYARITLNSNVTLTQNIYICAEKITFNFNGYTLDLNGYDLVLYSYYNAEKDRNGITFIDDGKYDEAIGENKQGRIINSAEGKGLLVLAANNGHLQLGNVNVEANIFVSDVDSRQTLCDSVLKNAGYTLVLGNRTLPVQKIEK